MPFLGTACLSLTLSPSLNIALTPYAPPFHLGPLFLPLTLLNFPLMYLIISTLPSPYSLLLCSKLPHTFSPFPPSLPSPPAYCDPVRPHGTRHVQQGQGGGVRAQEAQPDRVQDARRPPLPQERECKTSKGTIIYCYGKGSVCMFVYLTIPYHITQSSSFICLPFTTSGLHCIHYHIFTISPGCGPAGREGRAGAAAEDPAGERGDHEGGQPPRGDHEEPDHAQAQDAGGEEEAAGSQEGGAWKHPNKRHPLSCLQCPMYQITSE